MTNYTNPPGRQLKSEAEATEAIRENKEQASKAAKRGWATRYRNARNLDRMIAEAVARDTR